jgi:DNA-binding transcriptional LysR family regulator
VEELPKHRAIWFCRPGHPLTKRRKVTHDDLRRYPLAFMTLPSRLFHSVGRWPPDEAPNGPTGTVDIGVHTASHHMIRDIVRKCDAISVAVPSQIRGDVAQGVLVELEVDGPPAFTNYGIIRLAHRTQSPAAKLFTRLLIEIERQLAGEAGTPQ